MHRAFTAALGVAALLAVTVSLPTPAGASASFRRASPEAAVDSTVRAHHGPRVLGWGVTGELAMVVDGPDLFATNGFSVIELKAATGAFVRTISGPSYHFSSARAMVADGADLFVANFGLVESDSSVTELKASTGDLVRVISASYRFDYPDALALGGGDLFVSNDGANSVTELNARTAKLVRVVPGLSAAGGARDGPVRERWPGGRDQRQDRGAGLGGPVGRRPRRLSDRPGASRRRPFLCHLFGSAGRWLD